MVINCLCYTFYYNILTVIPLVLTLRTQMETLWYSENPRYQKGDSHQPPSYHAMLYKGSQAKFLY